MLRLISGDKAAVDEATPPLLVCFFFWSCYYFQKRIQTDCPIGNANMSLVLNRTVRLRVGAGAAKPGPAIGQALGPLGLNMAEFCKQFNDRTKSYDKDVPVPVVLSGR
jgi:hypothetical protein